LVVERRPTVLGLGSLAQAQAMWRRGHRDVTHGGSSTDVSLEVRIATSWDHYLVLALCRNECDKCARAAEGHAWHAQPTPEVGTRAKPEASATA
jgi:hypothetical protein